MKMPNQCRKKTEMCRPTTAGGSSTTILFFFLQWKNYFLDALQRVAKFSSILRTLDCLDLNFESTGLDLVREYVDRIPILLPCLLNLKSVAKLKLFVFFAPFYSSSGFLTV